MISSDDSRLTLGRFLDDIAERYGDRRAIFFEGRILTFAELAADSRALSRALVGAGVVKGTRVAVLMSNRPEFIVCAFAIARVGGVLVPVNTFANVEERDFILRHSDTSVLLLQSTLLKHAYVDELRAAHPELDRGVPGRLRIPELPCLRRVVALDATETSGGIESWADLLAYGEDVSNELVDAICAEVEPADDGVIIYTSGTTADPKGVLHAQRSPVLQGYRFADILLYDPDDRVYTAYPFFWGAGLAMSIAGTLAAGASLLLEQTFDPGSALEVMEAQRATALHAWAHQQSAIAEHPSAASRDLSMLAKVESSGPMGKLLGVEKDVYGVGSSYGLSETFTLSSMLPANTPAPIRRATHGRPLPGMTIRIVDPESGEPLPTGAAGEIAVKGVTFMRGYYKTLPETFLDENGFYRTQDSGSLDAEGYLHWSGRLSNVIKTGGANVSPVEIERCVAGCPGVHDGIALGIPHPKLGEVIVLGVTPNEGATVVPEDVRDYLRGKLSSYKVPRCVLVFREEELSYTGTQKVQVAPVREIVVSRLERERAVIAGHQYGVADPAS